MIIENILAACLAETLTMPLDTKKVLNQVNLQQKNYFRGIVPGYLRQLTYGGIRLGLYPEIMNYAPNSNIIYKVGAGLISGSLGIIVASPTDLVKIRMQSGINRSISQAVNQIYSRHGIRGFWLGLWPNVVRNSVMNMAELVAFDIYKNNRNLSIKETAIGGAFAGLAGAIVGGPVDKYKSRKMAGVSITMADFKLKTVYNGFRYNLGRLVGFNVILFTSIENLRTSRNCDIN
jgi:solute carrier family 25 uncoupling protein 8/9